MANDPVLWNGRWKALLRERSAADDAVRALVAQGFGAIAARVAVGRLGRDASTLAAPTLRSLQHYRDLPDIERAADRIAKAIVDGERIAVFVDYDTDGSSAGAILHGSLVTLYGAGEERVTLLIGHRLRDGYGLTQAIAQRVLRLAPAPTLLITADCGSADEARIAWLKARGIDTIVTDHHEIPQDHAPNSAFAFVSPKREGSRYDPNIAGCMVAFLLMASVRSALQARGALPEGGADLTPMLEYAALGSLADCVDIGRSVTNRAVIRSGLRRINQGLRPCWRVASERFGQGEMRLTSKDLVFGIVPRINAHSRVAEAMPGFRYLTAANDAEAARWYALLNSANEARKAIERHMTDAAMAIAERQADAGRCALFAWLPDGHPGVQGIVASRLVDRFARPAVCLSPHATEGELCSGSLRSVAGYSVSDGLAWIKQESGVLLAGGGHAMAGGVTLKRAHLGRFEALFEQSVRSRLGGASFVSVIEHDGVLPCHALTGHLIDELATVEPFGQGFPRPVFLLQDVIAEGLRGLGKERLHLRLSLRQGGRRAEGVWFFARASEEAAWPLREGGVYTLAVEPEVNWWLGQARVQARVLGVVLAEEASVGALREGDGLLRGVGGLLR